MDDSPISLYGFDAQPSATVLAVVGEHAEDVLETLEDAAGVETLRLRDEDGAVAAGRLGAVRAACVVHDADPLEHVAGAWVDFFAGYASLGTVDVEVTEALEQFDRGRVVMPDYYLVVAPDEVDPTWRHWWCGALGRHAPRRIVPVAAPTGSRDSRARDGPPAPAHLASLSGARVVASGPAVRDPGPGGPERVTSVLRSVWRPRPQPVGWGHGESTLHRRRAERLHGGRGTGRRRR